MNRAKRTLIFAHRGANNEAAENTCAAFDKALSYAIDGIETDVQLSRDEVAVLWHDRFLGKLGLPDKHIDDFDFAQLQVISKAAGIVTLQEFLDAYRVRCRLLIEIKNREWESASRHEMKVRQSLDMVGDMIGARASCPQTSGQDARAPRDEMIMISSFNLDSLIYAHQLRPEFPLIYNFETDQTIADAQRILDGQSFLYGLCLPIESLDEEWVKLLRDQVKCIAVYTCNSDEEINKALSLKVDILISDDPGKALQMRDA